MCVIIMSGFCKSSIMVWCDLNGCPVCVTSHISHIKNLERNRINQDWVSHTGIYIWGEPALCRPARWNSRMFNTSPLRSYGIRAHLFTFWLNRTSTCLFFFFCPQGVWLWQMSDCQWVECNWHDERWHISSLQPATTWLSKDTAV